MAKRCLIIHTHTKKDVESTIGSRIKTLYGFKTNMMKEGDHNQYINSVCEEWRGKGKDNSGTIF